MRVGKIIESDDIADYYKNNKFKSTREVSNPLCPVYRLPYVEEIEPIIPVFIRD